MGPIPASALLPWLRPGSWSQWPQVVTQPPCRTFQLSEKLQDTENEAMSKIVELEKQLMQRNKELDVVRVSVTVSAGVGPRGGRSGPPPAQRPCQSNALGQPVCGDCFRGDPPRKGHRCGLNTCVYNHTLRALCPCHRF